MSLKRKEPLVIPALRKHLPREEQSAQEIDRLVDEVMEIGRHFAALPVLDQRTREAMLYDESGLPA
jgi:hypothetical protein